VRYVLHQGESFPIDQIGQRVSNTIRYPPDAKQYLTELAN